MKKKILVLSAVTLLSLSGCGNRQIIDTNFKFEKAIVRLQDGTVIEGDVESWRDYDGDQIQVKIDGHTYLVHSVNVTLIK